MRDFNRPPDRTKSLLEKWDSDILVKKFGSDDVLPFWIADMDFPTSPAIIDRLAERTRQSIFGYECVPQSLLNAIVQWNATRHNWKISSTSVCFTAGTMNSIVLMLKAFTNKHDGVIIQPPVYFQFQSAIENCDRTVVSNPLVYSDGRYEMDFDDLEQKAATASAKVLLLCNPHNPVGRVWNREELQRVADICLRHDVLVLSDEVHADFVFDGHKYTPFSALSDEVALRSVSCLSPAKAFNIPSIATGFAIIPNDSLRAAFEHQSGKSLLNHINAFSSVATEAAYTQSTDWLDSTVHYVQQNAEELCEAFRKRIPSVGVIRPEGTFLAWLDFRQLEMSPAQLDVFLAEQAKIALKAGHPFGPSGEGFARMTIACSRTLLEDATQRLELAVNELTS